MMDEIIQTHYNEKIESDSPTTDRPSVTHPSNMITNDNEAVVFNFQQKLVNKYEKGCEGIWVNDEVISGEQELVINDPKLEAVKSNMKIVEPTYTQVCPYSCLVCDKTFTLKKILKQKSRKCLKVRI